jgi:hypothetical protein
VKGCDCRRRSFGHRSDRNRCRGRGALVSIRYPADPAAATTATIAIIDTDRIGSCRSNLPKVFCPNEVDDAS